MSVKDTIQQLFKGTGMTDASKEAFSSPVKPETVEPEHRENVPQDLISTEDKPSRKPTKGDHETFVGSIDQGTTSTRFLIFDKNGNPVASHQLEFKQYYPKPGWHEHDPEEILSSAQTCIDKAVEKFESDGYSRKSIAAIGITNQRETTLVWDKHTGESLHNAIAWPDTRTKSLVRQLKEQSGSDKLREICGLPLSTYPSSVKLKWLLENVEKVKEAYREDRLAFGTVDTWLLYRLNGRKHKNVFVTDATNGCRTMFVDLHKLEYSDQSLEFFGIDKNKIALPKIVPSSDPEAFGVLADGALKGVKIAGCLGDQSAALVGQCGFDPGMAKNTYGTGCFLLYNVGEKPVLSSHGLLATVGYHFGGDRKPIYALEGSIAVAGSGVKFLVNNLGLGEKSEKISELAGTVEDNGGCVFVTAFSGLFAPYWIDDAQGTIFGITQHTTKGHIARATIEATCFQTKAILDAMEKDCGHKLSELAVDGGMTNSDLVMQTQADILSIPVDRPSMRETTSLGAAIAAGFAVGVWKEFSELKNINREGRQVFKPKISQQQSASMFKLWSKAVEMCRGWVDAEKKDQQEDKAEHEKSEEDTIQSQDEDQPLGGIKRGGYRGGAHGGVVNVETWKGDLLDGEQSKVDSKTGDTSTHDQEEQPLGGLKRGGHRGGAHGGVVNVETWQGDLLDAGQSQKELPAAGTASPNQGEQPLGGVRRMAHPRGGAHGGVVNVETFDGNLLDNNRGKEGQTAGEKEQK